MCVFSGYPAITLSDYHEILSPFFGFHINNIGDPFISSNYAMHSRQFEVAVLDWFATLWELGDSEYWGYITTGGTEGNLHGLLLGLVIIFIICRLLPLFFLLITL